MIKLPRHLSPWASRLALFPEDIALFLGPFIARLSNLVGGWQLDQAGEGTPDGYDGIGRRGSYDRLLVTEWLVLEELPDEFIRRVVSGEHSFLQRAYRQEASAKRSVALFDTGVDQLGAPRIAHLAALIVLAQRAEQNGALLEWGIFQDSSVTLRRSVTEASVLDLLKGRCARPVSNEDIDRWMSSTDIATASELWFVGAEGLVDPAQKYRASALTVSDVLEPGPPQRIRVAAASAGRTRLREATLEIPPGRPAVQLLRDPFAAAVAPRQATRAQIDIHSSLVFSPDGRRLYVRAVNRALLTYSIPNSPHAPPGPSAAFAPPKGHLVIAVGQSSSKKRTLVATQHENEVAVHVLSKRGGTATRTERYFATDYPSPKVAADVPLLPLGVPGPQHFCFIDAKGNLVELRNGQLAIREQAFEVGSKALRDGLAYLGLRDGVPRVMWARAAKTGDLEITPSSIELPGMPRVLRFYFGALGLADLIAYSASEASWVIVHQQQAVMVDVPRTHSVVGILERGYPKAEPFLVAVNESRTRIELIHPSRSETLLTTAAPITVAAASDAGREIAYVTQAGELGVYSCTSSAMVLRLALEGAP